MQVANLLISIGDNMVKDNIKELDVYVEELEGNSIYEIDSVQDYRKLEEILKNEN
ncbi:CTP:phosphocholine cytidylyltransferase [Streptococcus pneumoniae]|nr:CTP:phosphocholine cytidylyltransferase [Streptococcus pneumoniae]